MSDWPELPLSDWLDTKNTLHRWTQVVGKIRLALTPLVNHWWNVPLYVSGRGLTTSMIPYGDRWFDMEFDFVAHVLRVRASDGAEHDVPLGPRSVADLHQEIFSVLKSLRIDCRIWPMPVEIVENVIPLDQDRHHRSYDRDAVERFWRILALADATLTKFRAEFIGKCSPVHFFWGGFDLAVTRFSGRRAPARPDADAMNREAYSHEVSSVGWWPGDSGRLEQSSFYSYAAPEPEGYRDSAVLPSSTYYNAALGGFYLPYDDVRRSDDPEKTLLDFSHSTYDAAASLGKWDRASLERKAT
ncbi:MAG TPA: DUF5996 family protein [Thermoanaerobaculia bacterium]|jgi:hypothetical protein|nr:DUF5996 family protein [Thermoanaerobaculia bacterium]